MKNDEIVIKISKDVNLSDAVCQAMHGSDVCEKQKLHSSVKPSLNQENADLQEGESAYLNSEWKNQINVMLG
ncbi:MAG: hypothetical protein GQ531_00330 [Sulfurovum sp.]|nr:hypothetical protein [Sulfurovum sp.]